jgi:von Hippel-Lindau disease tumor suppressor protein
MTTARPFYVVAQAIKKNDKRLWFATVLGLLFGFMALAPCAAGENAKVVPIHPPELGFFSKQVVYEGIPIKAHQDVSDAALLEARRRIARMLAHIPVVVQNLVDVDAQMHVIGKDQLTSDLPYLRHWKGKSYEAHGKTFESIDQRTRGIGGVLASCGEENLLKLPADRFTDHRDICTHEFAHTVFGYGLSPNVQQTIREQFKKSTGEGLWKTAYASTNADEFFAELSMWYFDSRGDYGQIVPAPQEGRAWLRKYDPGAFDVLDTIYSGRATVERITWQELAALPAKDETSLRSLNAEEPTMFLLVNRTSTDYALFWLDYEGKRRPYGMLHAGENQGQNTFATHPWLVATPDGQAVGIYVPGKLHAKAVLK